MGYRWIVKCKRCSADITFKIVDQQYARDLLTAEPPKPVMVRQAWECALRHAVTEYMCHDLQFRPA